MVIWFKKINNQYLISIILFYTRPPLSDEFKYSLVSGALTGGGLTVIANAPNPAGFSILKPSFEEGAISPLYLFLYALPPTIIAIIAFRFI